MDFTLSLRSVFLRLWVIYDVDIMCGYDFNTPDKCLIYWVCHRTWTQSHRIQDPGKSLGSICRPKSKKHQNLHKSCALFQNWIFLLLFCFHSANAEIKSRRIDYVCCRPTWLARWCWALLTLSLGCYIWSGTGAIGISPRCIKIRVFFSLNGCGPTLKTRWNPNHPSRNLRQMRPSIGSCGQQLSRRKCAIC